MIEEQNSISIRNLSKRYRIGVQHETYDSLMENIISMVKSPFNNFMNLRSLSKFSNEETGEQIVWALKDVSFDVMQGEVLGIIGPNGAGKSTLLKILSRITDPTDGRIELIGRVASLLEIGTGMHPELTGRDNIYMNGAMLGMSKSEIENKFDQIVEFSGVEKFIDTPVKRFSSGMSVRLGFAVAAHLDPEILMVDEVLAVGDARFRKKCLEKMEDISKVGKTVLFVSHNMSAIKNLCQSCILLNSGKMIMKGKTDDVINRYLNDYVGSERKIFQVKKNHQKKSMYLSDIGIFNTNGNSNSIFSVDEKILIDLEFHIHSIIPGVYGYLKFSNLDGTNILVSLSNDNNDDDPLSKLDIGKSTIRVTIPPRTLGAGDYSIYLSLASSQNLDGFIIDVPGEVGHFTLNDFNTMRGNDREGYLSTILEWKHINQK